MFSRLAFGCWNWTDFCSFGGSVWFLCKDGVISLTRELVKVRWGAPDYELSDWFATELEVPLGSTIVFYFFKLKSLIGGEEVFEFCFLFLKPLTDSPIVGGVDVVESFFFLLLSVFIVFRIDHDVIALSWFKSRATFFSVVSVFLFNRLATNLASMPNFSSPVSTLLSLSPALLSVLVYIPPLPRLKLVRFLDILNFVPGLPRAAAPFFTAEANREPTLEGLWLFVEPPLA